MYMPDNSMYVNRHVRVYIYIYMYTYTHHVTIMPSLAHLFERCASAGFTRHPQWETKPLAREMAVQV